MRNLLLIADSTFAARDDKGNIYFSGSFSPKTWQRYLDIADNVHFVCRKDRHTYTEQEAKVKFQKSPTDRISVVYIKNNKGSVRDFLNISISKNNLLSIEKEIKACDGVIIRTLGSIDASRVIRLIKKYNKRYLYECVGNAWDALWNYGMKGKILAPSAYMSEKKLANNADAVLYVTENYLQRWYPTSAPQIGVSDVDIPIPNEKGLINRLERIGHKPEKITLGTIGSVEVAYKGQEYVIMAMKRLLNESRIDIEYQLVGGGDKSRLSQMAADAGIGDRVKFLGSLPHDSIFEWLDTIDIYIQPSNLEGMPRALIEAMSRGVPCLGSHVGGIPELLEPDYMFKKKCPTKIAECIERLLSNKLDEQARRNYEFCKKFYPGEKDRMRTVFYREFSRKCEETRK